MHKAPAAGNGASTRIWRAHGMNNLLRVGVAGLGTVGASVIRLLERQKEALKARTGVEIMLRGVSARDKERDRGLALNDIPWFDDPANLAASPFIDVFVELVGGADGVAKEAVEQAFRTRKHVVTANKALLAKHGMALAAEAEAQKVALAFEASVAGGIPIVKTLREGLAGNEIRRVYGILNGTCNYILSTMEDTGRDFADVLSEAQAQRMVQTLKQGTLIAVAATVARSSARRVPRPKHRECIWYPCCFGAPLVAFRDSAVTARL